MGNSQCGSHYTEFSVEHALSQLNNPAWADSSLCCLLVGVLYHCSGLVLLDHRWIFIGRRPEPGRICSPTCQYAGLLAAGLAPC